MILGLLCGIAAGIIAALILVYCRPARWWFLPIVIISQALPVFAIAPLFVIWFGYGMTSKVAITMLMLFFPVTSSFYDGLCRVPKHYLELATLAQASRWQTLRYIQVPAALPALASGIRVAATYAPMGAVIGEWVGASRGLGFLMLNANARMEIDLVFAVLITIMLLTLLLYFTLDYLLKRWIWWQHH
ncbi:MAG: ABC transporter permease subunit [Gammaproteobacteria bacterium]|nr:ABC transporter permease subunit [Gammaproteobacteria bacterium]